MFRQMIHEELVHHEQRNRADTRGIIEEALVKHAQEEVLFLREKDVARIQRIIECRQDNPRESILG